MPQFKISLMFLIFLLTQPHGNATSKYHRPQRYDQVGSDRSCDLIIFSCNRPLQLHALLESVEMYVTHLNTVFILYRTSSDLFEQAYTTLKTMHPKTVFISQKEAPHDFKSLLMDIITKLSKSSYLLFAVDDIIITDTVDIKTCINAIEQNDAYGFYLRMGKNITHHNVCNEQCQIIQPPLIKTASNPDILEWQFNQGSHGWNYPHTVDLTMYNKQHLVKSFSTMHYNSPNKLEAQWATKSRIKKTGLCFAHSKMINIPINRVQTDYNNGTMNLFSAEQFLDAFRQGLKIDICAFFRFNNNATHSFIPVNLIPLDSHRSLLNKP